MVQGYQGNQMNPELCLPFLNCGMLWNEPLKMFTLESLESECITLHGKRTLQVRLKILRCRDDQLYAPRVIEDHRLHLYRLSKMER
jgi:hypothetical protein